MNITFLNLAAQSPTLELNYSLSEKIHRDNNMHHKFFMCDSALLSCSVNIDNKTSICRICKYKAQKGFKAFKERNENATLIKIKRKGLMPHNGYRLFNSSKLNSIVNFKLLNIKYNKFYK